MDTIKVWMRNEWLYYYYSKLRTSLQKYIDDTFEANLIIDNLWLGALSSAVNREKLHENNIDTIISAIYGSCASYPFDFDYERASLMDTENEDIIAEFYKLLPNIHRKILLGKAVLVHCIHGKSRSASIVAAYLIYYKKMSTDDALSFIKSKRTQIDPNPGYVVQLRKFEDEVRRKSLMGENKESDKKND